MSALLMALVSITDVRCCLLYLIICLSSWRCPCLFMCQFMWKNGTCYHEVVESAVVNKSFSVVIYFTYSMASCYVFTSFIVFSNFGISIPHYYEYVMLMNNVHNCLKLSVEIVFIFDVGFICWCIDLYDR